MTCTAAFMHIPSPALGACVLAGIERDTRGCMLDDVERFNYYPATPMAVISWTFEGTLHMVQEQEHEPGLRPRLGPALPRLVLSGPQRSPSVSWSPGPVHALSVGFYPEALSRLIDQPIEPYLNQHLPLETVAPPPLLQACQAILDGDEPFSTLEAQFQLLWREPGRTSPAPYLGDWVRSLATRALHSTAGKSLRQLQRRVRDWTGQSYRDLQLFIRVEDAFIRHIEAHDNRESNLAAIAADAGFADQSHMGRKIRRVTGMSPACFGECLANDEAFWYYRLIAGELRRQPIDPTKLTLQGPTRQSTRMPRDNAAQRQ